MADPAAGTDRSPAPAVVARDVTLAYGSRVALTVDHLELPAGRVTALIGPNGSGKSTLLHGLAGVIAPRHGRLDVHVVGPPAYVLQSTSRTDTLALTVREAVTMGRYARTGLLGRLTRSDRAVVDRALERLEITDLADRQLRELSGGERQRTLVAQGLAQESDLLLLDEPLTGLDLASRRRILEQIEHERSRGVTVVLSTHDLGDARHAECAVLLAGRVVACGPPPEVLTASHLAEAYGGRLQRFDEGLFLLDDAPAHGHGHGHEHGLDEEGTAPIEELGDAAPRGPGPTAP